MQVGEGRALYNLGNVYHAQGKHLGRVGPQEPGGFSDEVKHCLQKAVEYYAGNLALMAQLKDRLVVLMCYRKYLSFFIFSRLHCFIYLFYYNLSIICSSQYLYLL